MTGMMVVMLMPANMAFGTMSVLTTPYVQSDNDADSDSSVHDDRGGSSSTNTGAANDISTPPLFEGRNFVFDRRIQDRRAGGSEGTVVGRCANCGADHDVFNRHDQARTNDYKLSICPSVLLLLLPVHLTLFTCS